MNVASPPFFVFLAVVLTGYHLLPRRTLKYGWLTLASWAFYAWASPGYLWVILLLTAIDYWAGRRIAASDDERVRKRWLTLSIVSNLGLLAAFKYTEFVFDNAVSLARLFGADAPDRAWGILLPLGISFHTFQGISYTVDVYRRLIPTVR
ncbi:MAG: MBOAT family protein, partial [Gemmataceae bacterium]